MTEQPDERTLTIADLLRELGWDTTQGRSALNRYLAVEETRLLLGAKGERRPVFPAASVAYLRELKARHDAGKVTPRDGPRLLRELIADGQ